MTTKILPNYITMEYYYPNNKFIYIDNDEVKIINEEIKEIKKINEKNLFIYIFDYLFH